MLWFSNPEIELISFHMVADDRLVLVNPAVVGDHIEIILKRG